MNQAAHNFEGRPSDPKGQIHTQYTLALGVGHPNGSGAGTLFIGPRLNSVEEVRKRKGEKFFFEMANELTREITRNESVVVVVGVQDEREIVIAHQVRSWFM